MPIRPTAERRRALRALGLGAAIVASILGAPFGSAGADTVSNLRAQASTLAKAMTLEQLQVGGYTQQYNEATAKAQHDQAELAQISTQIAADDANIERDHHALAREVVRAYVNAGQNKSGTQFLFTSTDLVSTEKFYEGVMTGSLVATLDLLRIDTVSLKSAKTSLTALTSQAQQQAQVAASMLSRAQSVENQLAQQHATISAALSAAINALWAQEGQAIIMHYGVTGQPVLNAFLDCVIMAESNGNYRDVSATGQYMGAFQFLQSTWNEAAMLADLPTLVTVPPNEATPEQQDTLAVALYNFDGQQPWYDPCRSGF